MPHEVTPAPSFPPASGDLPALMAEVYLHMKRDDLVWCMARLERILEVYPWAQEPADLYGKIRARTHHLFSLEATFNLHDWMAAHNCRMGEPPFRDDRASIWRVNAMCEIIEDWLRENPVEDGAVIVDVGSQQGEVSCEFLAVPGVRGCICVEVSLISSLYGRTVHPDPRLTYVCGFGGMEGAHLPLAASSVDVAVLSGVLEHVLAPDVMLQEAERVVRPGGLIVVQVPFGGMEGGQINPAADILSFRSHVHSIDPYAILKRGEKQVALRYQSQAADALSPHSWYGEVGDWALAYETHRCPAAEKRPSGPLACPACTGPLDTGGSFLLCRSCGVEYPVRGGVHVLLPAAIQPLAAGRGV